MSQFSMFVFRQDLFRYVFPYGVPRNSFIVLAGEGGSGKSVIVSYIVKDFLLSGEPAVLVALDDDPRTVLDQLRSFGVDVDRYCNSKQLLVVDGYSYLMRVRRSVSCVEESLVPDSPDKIVEAINSVVERHSISGKGVIVIDSLNDVLMLLDPARVAMFVKSLRANFAKARDIVTIATLHTSTPSFREYLLAIEHIVDGIVETAPIAPELAQHIPICVRQLVVRKMKGVSTKQGPVLYGVDNEGLKPVIIQIAGQGRR